MFLKQGTIKTRVSQNSFRCQLKILYGNGSTKERTMGRKGDTEMANIIVGFVTLVLMACAGIRLA